ncbi:hypothetical protein DYB37_000280 [Aphanomyces astaci]|uniref:Uncharacterized protein n=1 Tax=Aphanomyces astaci TaxID=112090 RepID=A0A3R6WPG2_APHAT|nr:hypothetical protein DYB35_002558 [Aphanomyces astaci]RHZ27565.1 hypothetical protein DYB37_000280 [Aphanomyces astaci]
MKSHDSKVFLSNGILAFQFSNRDENQHPTKVSAMTTIFRRGSSYKAPPAEDDTSDASSQAAKAISKGKGSKQAKKGLSKADPPANAKAESPARHGVQSSPTTIEPSALPEAVGSRVDGKSLVLFKKCIVPAPRPSKPDTASTRASPDPQNATSPDPQNATHSDGISTPFTRKPTTSKPSKASKSSTVPSKAARAGHKSKASTKKATSTSKKLDAAGMKALVTLRMRATIAFVRFLRKAGVESGHVSSLVARFYDAHPGFKGSNLNGDRLQRYSKGLVTVDASNTNMLTVHPLDNLPHGTFRVDDVREVDFAFTFAFCVRFCDFFMSKYPTGCSFYTATKGFCAQYGVAWNGSPILKPMLEFYCHHVLNFDTANKVTVRIDAARHVTRLVSLLFLVWVQKHYAATKDAPWIEACNRFRRQFHLERQKMNHYDVLGCPWMHHVVMDKSKPVWRVHWATSAPAPPPSLLNLFVQHMHVTSEVQVPLFEDMSMWFSREVSDTDDRPHAATARVVGGSVAPREDTKDNNDEDTPQITPRTKRSSGAVRPDASKRRRGDPLGVIVNAKHDLFQQVAYSNVVGHSVEI